MLARPIEILMVEDSPGDVWLIRETLLQGSVPKNINVVHNGEHALDYVRQRGAYAAAPRPDLILLDLNLPRRDGLEVLGELKADPELRAITVVVLTTSSSPVDVNAAYGANANCYVVKPVDYDKFTLAIRAIEEFWMAMATLPTLLPPGRSEDNDLVAQDLGKTAGESEASKLSVRRGIRVRARRNSDSIRISDRARAQR